MTLKITELEFDLLVKEFRANEAKGELVDMNYTIPQTVYEGIIRNAEMHKVTQDELVHVYIRHYLFYHADDK